MKHKLIAWQDGLLWQSQSKRKGYTDSNWHEQHGVRVRLRILMLVSLVTMTVLVSRLIYLQVWEGERQLLFAQNNHVDLVREVADRGMILDRRETPLVRNVLLESEGGEQVVRREYGYGRALAPVVGYLAEARESELGCVDGHCIGLGTQVGRAGVEKLMESLLRGKDGGRVVEYSASGKVLREVGATAPEPGSAVVLSIEARLSQIAYEAMGGRAGAVVALDTHGKVLALVSSPSYDPNWFSLGQDQAELAIALQDEQKQYFLNRAIGGSYAPGSVFKPVVVYAGLVGRKIEMTETIEDTGEIKIDSYRFGNWYFDKYGKTEGKIDVVRALARSNDIFFYQLGERVGVDGISAWAKKFGIGEPTGIELSGEVTGYLPTPLLKERRTGEKWYLGNTYHLSIGQGDLTATPLQIARMALGVVSGRMCKISILRDSKVACSELGIASEYQAVVREGMRQACASGGTAFSFFDDPVPVLCKTGTAEHAGQVGSSNEPVLPHAWIIVATPAENPEMILVVFLDSAGEGSAEAGPVAKEILDKWRAERGD